MFVAVTGFTLLVVVVRNFKMKLVVVFVCANAVAVKPAVVVVGGTKNRLC